MEDSDVDQVLDLMRVSLGETALLERTTELFEWKHIENPFGRSIALVAQEGDQIVGLRTFMRWELMTQSGDRLKCVRAVDTATHPDFQRRGIFRLLTEESVEIARDDGVAMIFNTPNTKSKPGYLKMGWKEVGSIGAMLRPSIYLARAGRGTDDVERYLETESEIDSQLQDREARGLRTPRTKAYLKWRFTGHPKARYFTATSQGSTAVLRPHRRNRRREVVVADLFGRPRDAIGAAVEAKRSAYLATWFSRGSPERAAALRSGFVPVPGFTALTLVYRPLATVPSNVGSLDAWDLAVSDLELL